MTEAIRFARDFTATTDALLALDQASSGRGRRQGKIVVAPTGLTSIEAAVVGALTSNPRSAEVLATKAGLTRADTRHALNTLAARELAVLRGGGWALACSSGDGLARMPGDVVGEGFALLCGDAEERLSGLRASSVDAIVTSSPYYHERDYGVAGQIGWEPTQDAFVSRLTGVLGQCARVLRPHGMIFFNFDDQIDNGRLACIDAKLTVRLPSIGLEKFREIIWHKTASKPNGTDKSPRHVYEKLHVLRRIGSRHYWDAYAAREDAKQGGKRRIGDVWEIGPANGAHSKGVHYAAFPAELVRRCLELGTSEAYCAKCGKPWERILERGLSTWRLVGATYAASRKVARRTGRLSDHSAKDENGKEVSPKMAEMRHIGWRPTCSHRGKPVPAVVADPFVGSGTTGIVAVERGCEFLGIDINPKSISDAHEAIGKARLG